DLTGKNDLPQLINIFKEAKLIVTNDSGPYHIANAMNKRVVAIFNGYLYGRFLPYPPEMNLQGICAYPKGVNSTESSDPTSLQVIDSILPEDVFALIRNKYFI